MSIICIIIIFLIAFLFSLGCKASLYNGKEFLCQRSTILAIIIFSLLTGLRYNVNAVDMDFENYCDIVQLGQLHYYYNHFELIPRLFVDIVHRLSLPVYSWFIMMSVSLIFFFTFAFRNDYKRFVSLSFIWFVLLYLSFVMNVMRQGVALTVYLCAVTYIPDKKWKNYLVLVCIAFCFHRTSIIWSPLYLLTYLDWENKHWRYYILIAFCLVMIFGLLAFFITKLSFVFDIMNMAEKIENVNTVGKTDDISRGSGFGVLFRYIRWVISIIASLKIARINHDRNLYIFVGIFLIGVIIDWFSMFNIASGRIGIYLQFVEVLIYPYIYRYVYQFKYSILFKSIMFVQLLVLIGQSMMYFSKWNFVTF